MQTRKPFVAAAAAVFALSCFGFAKSADRTKDVTFDLTVKFQNGATLPAGTYKMEVPETSQTPNVSFSQNGKVVATVPAKVVPEKKKNSQTEIDSVNQNNAETVTAIHPSGWNEALSFGQANQ